MKRDKAWKKQKNNKKKRIKHIFFFYSLNNSVWYSVLCQKTNKILHFMVKQMKLSNHVKNTKTIIFDTLLNSQHPGDVAVDSIALKITLKRHFVLWVKTLNKVKYVFHFKPINITYSIMSRWKFVPLWQIPQMVSFEIQI